MWKVGRGWVSLIKPGKEGAHKLDMSIKHNLRENVLAKLDSSTNIDDSEVMKVIDECLMKETEGEYVPLKEKILLKKEVFNSIRRYDVLSEILEDDEVTEVMINDYNNIYVEKAGRIYKENRCFESREKLMTVVQSIVSRTNRRVNDSNPIADAILPDGSRVNIVLGGVSCDGTTVTVRKFPKRIMGMEELIALETIDRETAEFLGKLVKAGYNIFISGGTGAGKTTFLNALSGYIPQDERVITIEDSAELRIRGIKNLVRLEARTGNVEGENAITIRDLIRTSLRMRPDRIIVGEVRDEAAIDMLSAMNTGHDGSISTGHANSAEDMMRRLESMVLMGAPLPILAIRQQIASAIDIVIHLGRLRDRSRKVLGISEVIGMKDGEIILSRLYEFEEQKETEGRIIGKLKKANDLMHIGKLASAGLLTIAREEGA